MPHPAPIRPHRIRLWILAEHDHAENPNPTAPPLDTSHLARGFAVNGGDSAAWRVLATGVTLVVPLTGLVHVTGSAGGAFRIHRQNYFIDEGPAEVQPAFAPFLGVGLALAWKIGDE